MSWWKAVVKWAEARAVGNAPALSTARGPLRAPARTVHLSTASRRGRFRGRCAKPDRPL